MEKNGVLFKLLSKQIICVFYFDNEIMLLQTNFLNILL